MAIYENSFSGLKLSTSLINNLNLTEDDIRGYFSESDLRPLLDLPNCIGIRIYNNKKANIAGSLIASAVNANGFDIPDSNGDHLMSFRADNPIDNSGKTAGIIRRSNASIELGGGMIEEQFSSFFLKDTLDALLKDPRFTGVCFYKTNLDAVPSPLLPPGLNATGKLTHLAITSDIINNKIVGIDSNLAFDNVFSDRPCPGHCVTLDTNGMAMAAENPIIVAEDDFTGPYIPAWH